MLNRRSLLGGIIAACAAPAIIRSGVLMPVKPGLVGVAGLKVGDVFTITGMGQFEVTLSVSEFSERFIAPAMSILARKIESELLSDDVFMVSGFA